MYYAICIHSPNQIALPFSQTSLIDCSLEVAGAMHGDGAV